MKDLLAASADHRAFELRTKALLEALDKRETDEILSEELSGKEARIRKAKEKIERAEELAKN